MMINLKPIKIEVAYSAASGAQAIITVNLLADSTVADAIIASKILEFSCFPEFSDLNLQESESHKASHNKKIDIQKLADRVGIFGKKVALETELRSGDRVEIYRPLQMDPKEARRKRAVRYPIKKIKK